MHLNFHRENTTRGPHGLHAFGAKLPPQLPRWAIERYSQAGDVVCDPMCGSGTTLVEAVALGRRAIGCDLDPLACLISAAKSTPLDPSELLAANARLRLSLENRQRPHAAPHRLWSGVALPRKERWFTDAVADDLCALKAAIAAADASPEVRRLWQALFSSLITARTSVANGRDIVHSRHHYRAHATPPDTMGRFVRRLSEAERRMMPGGGAAAVSVTCADARRLPIAPESVSLIVTSPPYCNALDYTRAHRFSVAWMESELGVTLGDYVRRGRDYIGSERGVFSGAPPCPIGIGAADEIMGRIAAEDAKRGRLVMRYARDMRRVIEETARVLKPGGHAVIVVCPSNIRQIAIDWHCVFSVMGESLAPGARLETVDLIEREIDDSRRILPYMNAGTRLGARMRREYVLALRKEARR